MEHTKLPWRVEPLNSGGLIVSTADPHNDGSNEVCEINGHWVHKHVQEGNAEFIVKACNNHERLVDALQRITKIETNYQELPSTFHARIEDIAFDALKSLEE